MSSLSTSSMRKLVARSAPGEATTTKEEEAYPVPGKEDVLGFTGVTGGFPGGEQTLKTPLGDRILPKARKMLPPPKKTHWTQVKEADQGDVGKELFGLTGGFPGGEVGLKGSRDPMTDDQKGFNATGKPITREIDAFTTFLPLAVVALLIAAGLGALLAPDLMTSLTEAASSLQQGGGGGEGSSEGSPLNLGSSNLPLVVGGVIAVPVSLKIVSNIVSAKVESAKDGVIELVKVGSLLAAASFLAVKVILE